MNKVSAIIGSRRSSSRRSPERRAATACAASRPLSPGRARLRARLRSRATLTNIAGAISSCVTFTGSDAAGFDREKLAGLAYFFPGRKVYRTGTAFLPALKPRQTARTFCFKVTVDGRCRPRRLIPPRFWCNSLISPSVSSAAVTDSKFSDGTTRRELVELLSGSCFFPSKKTWSCPAIFNKKRAAGRAVQGPSRAVSARGALRWPRSGSCPVR